MEFGWDPEQERLYTSALKFSRERLSDPREPGFSRERWRACGEFGFLGLCAPQEHGGLGLGALATARAIEALGQGCADTGFVFSVCAHLFACVKPIADLGSEAQQRAYLPKLCSGEWVGANAITEAEAGSDVFALRMTATREGTGYVLDGAKSYVTNGPVADFILTYATLNRAHGFMGITAFGVEVRAPGVQIGQPFEKLGLSSSPISTVYFESCRVGEEARIGPEGKGAQIFTHSMLWERSCLFAAYLGVMERQLEQTVAFAKQRRQFGKSIGRNQAVSHRIAEMKLRLEAARLLLYRACWTLDQGQDATLAVALAKVAVSESAVRSALDAIQIHGGMGYLRETGVETALRDSVGSTLFSGTTEMQRDIIANRLGL